MDESDVIVSSVEIIPDKLYFATLKGQYKPKSTKNSRYFSTRNAIVYANFFYDYGPHHLCHLYLFCKILNRLLSKMTPSRKLVFYSSDEKVQRLNAAYLIGSYAIIYLNKSPQEIFDLITEGSWELLTFRDASNGLLLFEISLLDVFEGLHKAHQGGFFDFENFNAEEYAYYEKVINGDLNWIIPGKMLAFSAPHSQTRIKDDYPLHAPSHYHKYFWDNNVTAIVRLNSKTYKAKQFTDFGFEHHDLFFVDGSNPSEAIVDAFNSICERTRGAVAVHCKAGLGRTGTLIACYLMKHYNFTARQSISWLRICRPGSVIGYQQNFLIGMQDKMMFRGFNHRLTKGISEIPKFKSGVYSSPKFKLSSEDELNGNFEASDDARSAEDLENVPGVEAFLRQFEREDSFTSAKNPGEDWKELESAINANKVDPVVTRSMTTKTRANSAISNTKPTQKSNCVSSARERPTAVKVQQTSAKKLQTTKTATTTLTSATPTVLPGTKPSYAFARGTVTHSIKVALTKSQYARGNRKSDSANCSPAARNGALRKKPIGESGESHLKNSSGGVIFDYEPDDLLDSLENIPSKMAARRREKSPDLLNNDVANSTTSNNNKVVVEACDPQGSRLCQIKATRSAKAPPRSYSGLAAASPKKK